MWKRSRNTDGVSLSPSLSSLTLLTRVAFDNYHGNIASSRHWNWQQSIGIFSVSAAPGFFPVSWLISLSRFLGAAVFLAVGESVFVQQLTSSLRSKAPTVNADLVVAAGAQGLQKVVSKADMPGVLVAYNDAIVAVFVSETSYK